MREKSNITVIIPIITLNNLTDYFKKCVDSISTQKLLPDEILMVIPKDNKEVKDFLDSYEYNDLIKSSVRIIENTGNTDFSSQVNFGVEEIKTDWFSVIEIDDEYSTIWFNNVLKYMESYGTEIECFLPIVIDVTTDGKFIHFTNEPVWAKDFSERMGYWDVDTLLNFSNIQISGSVIKKDAFKSVMGLKSNIKLHFVYEFFLRMSYYNKKIMTIPKIGYKKTNMRPDSLFYNYHKSETDRINSVEARYWFNQAKKEYLFKKERPITYIEENVQK